VVGGWIFNPIDKNTTIVKNYAVNDLKGSIPKFVVNAGASTHRDQFIRLRTLLDKMNESGDLKTSSDLITKYQSQSGFKESYERTMKL
jgi:hypothetical protein